MPCRCKFLASVILLPSNITVFTLGFSGSGVSCENYVSLGLHEVRKMGMRLGRDSLFLFGDTHVHYSSAFVGSVFGLCKGETKDRDGLHHGNIEICLHFSSSFIISKHRNVLKQYCTQVTRTFCDKFVIPRIKFKYVYIDG